MNASLIIKQLGDLAENTTETSVRLHNTMNQFLMLANTQFVENR